MTRLPSGPVVQWIEYGVLLVFMNFGTHLVEIQQHKIQMCSILCSELCS